MGNITAIVAMEARDKVDPAEPLEDRFRAAFKAVQGHWMATNPEDQFNGACGAVYASATDDEQARILSELRSLKALEAMLQGVLVDPSFAIEAPEGGHIGVMKLWHEAVGR